MAVMSAKFDTLIRTRLEASRGDWPALAERAGVSHSWLSKFANGHIRNPGLRTLERLDVALGRNRRKPATPTKEAA